jgi:putative ABC transport system permease protein
VQRSKEIGIRKILGAADLQIVALISGDFIKLVVVASLIAFPVAWFFMNQWLQNFAYRISISWWVFLAAGLTAAGVAMISVFFQAIKAAVANPVRSLRTE